jgi:iron(III) transport system permease protein
MAFGYLALSVRAQVWVSSEQSVNILKSIALHLHLSAESTKDFVDPRWLRNLVDVHENPTLLLVIAYAMRRLPYVVRSSVAGLEQTPVDLELAARNLGASGGFTLRKITLPLISANLIAGGLLAFAFAMLEVSDSLMLAQKQDFWPITRGIYEMFQRLGDGPYIASALGVWAMVLLTLTILSANSMLGKRMGAIFRV